MAPTTTKSTACKRTVKVCKDEPVHSIGEVYDAATDTFTNCLLFKSNMPSNFRKLTFNHRITKNEDGDSEEQGIADTKNQVFNLALASSSSSSSNLALVPKQDGWLSFLSASPKIASTKGWLTKTIELEVCTVYEALDRSLSEQMSYLDKSILKHGTHTVTGIQWGGKLKICIEVKLDTETSSQKKEVEDIGEAIGNFFKSLFGVATAKTETSLTKMEWRVKTEINGLESKQLSSMDEIKKYVIAFPSMITADKHNSGKGFPLHYTLGSLDIYKDNSKQQPFHKLVGMVIAILVILVALIFK